MFNKIINRLDRILYLKIEFKNLSQIKQLTSKIQVKHLRPNKINPINKLVLTLRLMLMVSLPRILLKVSLSNKHMVNKDSLLIELLL